MIATGFGPCTETAIGSGRGYAKVQKDRERQRFRALGRGLQEGVRRVLGEWGRWSTYIVTLPVPLHEGDALQEGAE